MNGNPFAPILVPTLNRHIHLKKCVDSLSKCNNAINSDLIIALDYPLKDEHWEGYSIIKDYVGNIEGFRKVVVIQRDVNYGVNENARDAINTIFKEYDRIIITEDDNIFAESFLDFVNDGLIAFKQRGDIFSICGYNFPIEIPKGYNKQFYLWSGFSAWGFGMWRSKYLDYKLNTDNESINYIEEFASNCNNLINLFYLGNHFVPIMVYSLRKKHFLGDLFWTIYGVKNKFYNVFPTENLVRNIGHDGSGVNNPLLKNNVYENQAIAIGKRLYSFDIFCLPDNRIYKALYNYFRLSLKSKFKHGILLVYTYIKIKLLKK
jgi:hypothetical protein